MTITDRVLEILHLLRLFKYLTTGLIQQYCVPNDRDRSVTREIMRKLHRSGYVNRYKAEVVNPLVNSTAPVYCPNQSGCAILATAKKDMSLLLDSDPPRAWQNLAHYVEVSQFLLMFRAAVQRQSFAEIAAMFLEHDVVNPQAESAADRYRLYTVVNEGKNGGGRIVCVPDALIGLRVGTFLTAYGLELETGSETPARCAAKKANGWAGMAEKGLYKRFLPNAGKLRVLAVVPNAAWRNAFVKELRNKPGKDLWRVVSAEDITPETFLHAPILHSCDREPMPLVQVASAATPVASPMEGARPDLVTKAIQ